MRRLKWAIYLGTAWLALRLIRLLLKVLGYRRTLRLLASLSPTPTRIGYTASMPIAARAIERVDDWWPRSPGGCLRRSLLFWWLYRWLNYHSEILTGVRREVGEFELHAWVESNGMILNDRAGKISQYTPLWDDISSSAIEREGRQ